MKTIYQKTKSPIIFYHSVAPAKNPAWFRNYLTLELKYFQDHLRLWNTLKLKTAFLDTYFRMNEEQASKHIFITFDDGYLDNWIYVFPMLKKYKIKATIFINPEFVDTQNTVRKNLDDYWSNRAGLDDINRWGFLSWEEMFIMLASGWVDIQSHTLTHTKYFVSDKITGFHHPGSDCLHAVGNLFPEKKPYYIEDRSFENAIPYGYPLFEEGAALTAQKITINDDFNREVAAALGKIDWHSPVDRDTGKLSRQIEPIYRCYRQNDNLVIGKETIEQYQLRVEEEIGRAKEVIEKSLMKRVDFCCWPFGDTDDYCHEKAMELGYLATTTGKHEPLSNDKQKIPRRTGLSVCKNNRLLTVLKALYKIKRQSNQLTPLTIKH
ncbi:MAG: polysaccharide deacetylase family protein [Acidobacteria bacterium]|nr:polysaccharide deacetylase family protein [Acidobacteriota bacterium]